MLDREEFYALFLVWLALATVVGYYVVRIALMLREQWLMERALRMHLALRRGRAVREAARENSARAG